MSIRAVTKQYKGLTILRMRPVSLIFTSVVLTKYILGYHTTLNALFLSTCMHVIGQPVSILTDRPATSRPERATKQLTGLPRSKPTG